MDNDFKVNALTPRRKLIAARMTESKQTIPHYRLMSEVEVDALVALRQELRESQPDKPLSLNDLLIKAVAAALMDVPELNVQWGEEGISQFTSANIAVVTAVPGGLSTPIVWGVERKSVWQIAVDIRELAARAMANSLKVNEIMGGTFSVSNLGMYGVDQFDAIINPPQCAILAVGTAKPRVVAGENGDTRVATTINATLSVDHRAIDGATGARFMAALRARMENPGFMRSQG